MSTIDQFESTFRSAIKPVYNHAKVTISDIVLITDLDADFAQQFKNQAQSFLASLGQNLKLHLLDAKQSYDLNQLLECIGELNPQLIITHRHLHAQNEEYIYTLGDHIEVLTQITQVPILLFPKTIVQGEAKPAAPSKVLVLTDQLIEHPRLVDYALTLIAKTGHLSLAHIEDEVQFERYINMVAKIPEIDTESARTFIREQMYKDAQNFFSVIDQTIKDQSLDINVQASFRMGHKLKTYVSLVAEDKVELVIIQGKDDDQIAMHGLSYPLAVELNHLPLLII